MVHYKMRRKSRRGTPIGYQHNWKYQGRWTEKKVKPGTWKISFKATKGKRARSLGAFKPGFKIHWKINADQYAIKTKKGMYQTHLVGTKKLVHSGYGKKFKSDHKKYKKYYKK